MPTVTLEGCTFNYSVVGEGNSPTIFVLHGGRGAGEHTQDFNCFAELGDTYRVIGFDQRGHGKSSDTAPFTFDRLADDVELLRQHFCGEEKCIVIGGSFGGFIALTFAARHPESFSKLVLRGTAPSPDCEAEAIEIMKGKRHLVPSLTEAMIEKLFSDRVESVEEFKLLWLAMQPLYADSPETFDAQAAFENTRDLPVHLLPHNDLYRPEVWAAWDMRPHLSSITQPTLILCGAKDWICPPSQSRLMAEAIPNAELLMVEGANHAVHIQAKATVMPVLRDFLAR